MIADGMSVAPSLRAKPRSVSLPASAVLLGGIVGVLFALARPGAFAVGVGALVVLPAFVLVLAGAARAVTLAGALAFGGTFVWAYTGYFAPLYAYQGMVDAGPEPAATLVVVALAALPAAWLPLSADRPSTVVLWFLYLLGYVPAVIVPLLLTGELVTVLPLVVSLLAAIAILSLLLRLPPAPLEPPRVAASAFAWVLAGLGLTSSLYIAATFGVHALPSLAEVYTTRSHFNTALGGAAAAGYVVPWAANAINPALMALGVARRRLELVALGLVGQLLIYANTGFKSVLFSILLVPLVYAAIAVARRSFGLVATLAAPAIIAAAVLADSLSGHWLIALVRRLFATPGQVGWYYHDYFSEHPHYQLSHSFLGWLLESPYSEDPPLLIGRVYFPNDDPNANAHLWADAFANFGFAGIFVFTVVLALILLVVDGLGRKRDARVYASMLAIAGMTLASSALFTTLLTLGFGVACLLIALMPPSPDDQRAAGPEG
jgi:hypothetical protein